MYCTALFEHLLYHIKPMYGSVGCTHIRHEHTSSAQSPSPSSVPPGFLSSCFPAFMPSAAVLPSAVLSVFAVSDEA
jgi:hypothetical protein